MGTMRGGMGMGMRAERSPHGRSARAGAEPPKKKTDFRKAMPEIWKLVRPRKWLLLLGLVLVAINRVAGLTLPFVSRPFVNLVLRKHESDKLMPLVVAVFIATVHPGDHFVFEHAVAVEGGAAHDRRSAPAGAAACGPPVGEFLRREPQRAAGFADHERRGRRAQPDRHWPGGVCRRPADGCDGVHLSAAPQPEDDADRVLR